MNELLLLNGKKATLRPSSIRRNLLINDIAEVKDRRANYSNTIDLPDCPENVALMDFLGVNGNTSLKPYRKISVDYYVEGVPLITKGNAVIKESFTGYKLVIYDGIIDLSEALKGKKLNELDFSAVNHYLTSTAAVASMATDSGYIYALADFGYKSFSAFKTEHQAPSLFISTVWDMIFSQAGIDYLGQFFDINADFKTEVTAPAKGYEVLDSASASTSLGNVGTEEITKFEQTQNSVKYEDPLNFDLDNATQLSLNAGALQVDFTGVLKLSLSVTYECGQNTYLRLRTLVNGSTRAWLSLSYLETSATQDVVFNVAAGDVISLMVDATDTNSQNFEQFTVEYTLSATATAEEVTGGQLIDFALMVSEMDQLDFIRDIMQRYGLLMKPIRNAAAYEFVQFEDLLNRRDTAEDWSEKLSALGPETYGIDYAKKNEISYKYPSEVTDFTHNGFIIVDNDNAPALKSLWTSPYEIANKSYILNQTPLYSVPIWKEEIEDGTPVKKELQTPVKLFRIFRNSTPVTLKLFGETTGVDATNPAYLSLNNISLQYYIGNYYQAFENLTSRAKNRAALMNLNELDIYNLDFFRLKYFKQTGRFYYLNGVSNTPGFLSDAELVEITQFSENLAPTVLGVFNIVLNYKASKLLTINQLTNFTNPLYFDPEFDPAKSVQFTGGFNAAVLLKDKTGAIINTVTEIQATDFPVTIEDAGTTTNPHAAAWTFKIKDTGSLQFSTVEGTINASVNEYFNQAPIANAGPDQNVQLGPILTAVSYPSLTGAGSSDTNQIVSYVWAILNSPVGNTATLADANTETPGAVLNLPHGDENLGTYEIQLTVTDDLGATGTDILLINVTR